MEEESPLYTWIDILSLSAAGAFTLAAAAIDCRTLRIPNRLTLPLVSLGLLLMALRCTAGLSMLIAVLTCAVSYALVYGLWRCHLWGGGDAKLALALFLIASPVYPPLYFIAAFSLCLATVLLLKHAMAGRAAMEQGRSKGGPLSAVDVASYTGVRGPMGPALSAAYALTVVALTAVSA